MIGRSPGPCALVAAAAVVALLGGCGMRRITDTPRTATEQLLVAAAVSQAVGQLDFAFLADRKVYLDDSRVFPRPGPAAGGGRAPLTGEVLGILSDRSFIIAEVRAAAMRSGVVLVNRPEAAQYILELRAGAVGTDRNDYILGVPAGQIPWPGAPVTTPEVPVYKSIVQAGACRVAFIAYAQADGRFFHASGPAYGFSDHKSRWILGAGPGTQDNIAPPREPVNTASVKRGPASPDETADRPE
ncbi:MAG: DUF6655 family protein [Planctomycetota bacterium]